MASAVAFGWQTYIQLIKLGALSSTAGGFFSGISLYLCLVLALNGAGPLSQTHRELWHALNQQTLPANMPLASLLQAEAGFNTQTSALMSALASQSSVNGTQLGIANGVWAKELPVLQDFADRMWKFYRTPVKSVNNTDPINKWARDKTGGLISQAVPPNAEFDLLLTNAVYFRAVWEYQFDKAETMKQTFTTVVDGLAEDVEVDMMYQDFIPREMTGKSVLYADIPGLFRAVKLPYKGSSMVAYAVLPDQGTYGLDVDAAAANISAEVLFDRSIWRTVYSLGKLEVLLPKFKIKTEQIPLKQALQALNVTAAFDRDGANFSRMSNASMFISDALQSTVVLVDEKGTEAAALTSVVMVTTSYVEYNTPPLVFDRPFMFLIVDDDTGAVLFQGTVKDPSQSMR